MAGWTTCTPKSSLFKTLGKRRRKTFGISKLSSFPLRLARRTATTSLHRIIMGAFSGGASSTNTQRPCTFIAICNILILREQIEILPRDRKTRLLRVPSPTSRRAHPPNCTRGGRLCRTINDALTWWRSSEGMDLNPVFISATTFRPTTTSEELMLFASAGITLVHGWLVYLASSEYDVSRAGLRLGHESDRGSGCDDS